MRVFSVQGKSGSGKTTVIEAVIKGLKERDHTVGSIKEIHFESFAIDEEGTDTDRHHRAGADLVSAWGLKETDLLYKRRLSLENLLNFYDHDFVALEGFGRNYIPKIITAHSIEDIEETLDGTVFAVSGQIAETIDEYRGLPVINVLAERERLIDIVEDKVFEKLPGFDDDCCLRCGLGCAGLARAIIGGKAVRGDCALKCDQIRLFIGGREIEMVDFVQRILANTVRGVCSELKGYQPNQKIEVRIGEQAED